MPDYLSQPNSGNFEAPPMQFNSFNSPPGADASTSNLDVHRGSPERKRKRMHPEDSSGDLSHHHGDFDSPNSPVHSNPDLDSYIKSRRKPREKKACQVCRKRKVGCDQQQPCQNCIDRRYPELCVYENPGSTDGTPGNQSNNGLTQMHEASHHHTSTNVFDSIASLSPEHRTTGSETVTIPREYLDRLLAKLDQFQRNSSDLSMDIRSIISHSSTNRPAVENGRYPYPPDKPKASGNLGMHTRNELTGQTVHVGGNSVPAFVMEYGSHLEGLLGSSILPAFALDNESATYPFVGLSDLKQGRMPRLVDLCKTIPNEVDLDRYFKPFRDVGAVVHPVMGNIVKFEAELLQFHIARTEALAIPGDENGINEQSFYGKSITWIGLLFATLASGCQCISPSKEMDLTSRVFVCCSFECLRLANFLSNPSLETIQTLLILGQVISNTMNAGVSWALLGLTTRLAQVLGIHNECRPSIPQSIRDEKKKVAWAIVWQESLLSITFDRVPSSTSLEMPDTTYMPYDSYAESGALSYTGCMYRVCRIGLNIIQERRTPRESLEILARMSKYETELQQVMGNAAGHLKNSSLCVSFREQLQHWALYLHVSYIMSEICRESIKPRIPQTELSIAMKATCLDSLANTVQGFLGLSRLTTFASHSWTALSRALSSALVLGVLGEAEQNEKNRDLLSQLLVCLREIMERNIDGNEISAPIKRWVATLSKLTGNRGSSSAGTSPVLELDSDDSPYARVDEIIWGGQLY